MNIRQRQGKMGNNKYMALVVATYVVAVLSVWQLASAADEDPLQDLGVADKAATPQPNGFARKLANQTAANDFKFSGLANPGNTNNRFQATVTPAFVQQFSGLNTLGISGVRIDFAPGGLNPPHIHPRATELFFLIRGGPVEVGFVTSNDPPNVLFATTLNAGDIFVFPRGLLHFQKNRGKQPAFAVAALNSQNPGVQQAVNALFNATNGPISVDILQQALGDVSPDIVQKLIAAQQP